MVHQSAGENKILKGTKYIQSKESNEDKGDLFLFEASWDKKPEYVVPSMPKPSG